MRWFTNKVLILALILCIQAWLIEVKDSLPLDNLAKLKNYNNLSYVDYNLNRNVVIIYTVSWCNPCVKLAKELEKYSKNDTILKRSIIFFNPSVMDIMALKDQIQKHYRYSPYYYIEFPNEINKTNAYPYIAFHAKNGALIDSIIGYHYNTAKKIIEHISK
ncbi:MAG: hypothetical protein IT276_04465 [Ignavibacteriaceae bacterium]|nr:hypothetical protein [Ignavibacteriaceae bacterium]